MVGLVAAAGPGNVAAMQPFERLRSLARWSDGDGTELVGEAADCLAAFDGDPAGLVVACRRLLAHHPSFAPLWWLCARVLAAPEASDGAWGAWQELHDDATPHRLSRALPFPHDEPIAVLGWPEVVAAALIERPDLDVLAVRVGARHDALSRRIRRSDTPVRVVDAIEVAALEPTHVLVEVAAAGGGTALVDAGTNELLRPLRAGGAAVWAVAPLGHALPERLLASMRAAAGQERRWEELEPAVADLVVGPHAAEALAALARRVDCAPAPELLRLGG